jgi:hypothetical protein
LGKTEKNSKEYLLARQKTRNRGEERRKIHSSCPGDHHKDVEKKII